MARRTGSPPHRAGTAFAAMLLDREKEMNAITRTPVRAPARPAPTALAALVAAATLGGCAWTAGYNAAYTNAARRPPAATYDGKVLVKTAAKDNAEVFSGNPTSFTGSATTLTMPLGQMSREIAKAAYADTFTGGADLANELRDPSAYAVIVAPRVVSFSYEYNQLKNVGFAITPTVRVTVNVQVLDDQGKAKWEKSYPSGDVEEARTG